jgi:hypothetical protein
VTSLFRLFIPNIYPELAKKISYRGMSGNDRFFGFWFKTLPPKYSCGYENGTAQ